MKKIMFHLNSLEIGGAERVVSNLAKEFTENGYEVVIATEWQGQEEYSLTERVKRIHVGLKDHDQNSSRLIKYWKRIQYLKNAIKDEKPDIVIAFAKKAIYRALMSTSRTKIPTIIAVRVDPVGHYESISDKILIPILFPKAAGGVFQTRSQREFFGNHIKAVTKVILNPISNQYLNRPEVIKRTKTIMHTGRLVACKNQSLLIEAFYRVHKQYPEYTLKLYGGDSFDGTLELLQNKIKSLQLENNVFLMGNSNQIEVDIEAGAIFISTSNYEGMPNAVIEAMALGMPVISTDCPCGGPAELIENGKNGLLIPIKNIDAAVEAMIYLIEHPIEANEMGNEARKIKEITNSRIIFGQWKEYVDSIV